MQPTSVRLLPSVGRHGGLRALAGGKIRSEGNCTMSCIVGDAEDQRRACVPMPDLDRIDAVPARHLALAQQEVDGRGRGARTVAAAIAKRLAEMPTLRMRRKPEQADNFVGGQVSHS